ncbi:unnamed protein product [Nippostrongylus brasiliensis]|uniref:E3 ubiquitin-protein ligase n=1 Tax=Nippostrongylus brasiliensis TaxID=27835 RepID=A0A0N4XWY9_NIPBR|nr:unnamed protein product [Nippostrongylus brasiliensis]
MTSEPDDDECPVCAQKMILPTAVPACGHKFCFLCIKGAAFGTQTFLCPMCRGEVAPTLFRNPAAQNLALDMRDPESPTVSLKPPQKSQPCSSGRTKRKRNLSCNDVAGPSIKKNCEQLEEPAAESLEESQEQEEPANVAADETRHYWLYKGRGGWWRFDPRTEKDIEHSRCNGDKTVDLVICGFMYVLDFERKVQYRKDAPNRIRDIK